MGKARRSSAKVRQRAAAAAEQDEAAQAQLLAEERTAAPLRSLPDDALFFLDTSADARIGRKVDRFRKKVLHCEASFQRGSLVPPVLWPKRRKGAPDGETALPPKAVKLKKSTLTSSEEVSGEKRKREADPWSVAEGGDGARQDGLKPVKKTKARAGTELRTEKKHLAAAAVEIDAPGCSYNPTFHDHQEALGEAVALEMRREYAKELQPEAPQLLLQADGRELEEGERFFLDVGGDNEDVDEDEAGEGTSSAGIARPVRVKKLTRADLNRRLRKRAAEAAHKKAADSKKLRNDIARLKELEAEVEDEKKLAENRCLRKEVARQEKQASVPPRLGRHRFEPETMKVLLTEEVTGSLRTLKGCDTLVRERFKSLQRRGLVEPRLPARRKKAQNRRLVEQGSRGRRERELHQEMLDRRAAKSGVQLTVLE